MPEERQKRDLATRPVPFLLVWGLPLLLAAAANFLDLSLTLVTVTLVVV